MKVDKKFVECYDYIFSYILDKWGLDELIEFWKKLAPVMLSDLVETVSKKGLKGCKEYWETTLTAEKAKFRIELKGGVLKLEVTDCPSIRHLNYPKCKEYCRHCGVMYPEVLKSLGLEYEWLKKGNGRCEITVREAGQKD